MSIIDQTINYTRSAVRHPLRLSARVGHFGILWGKQNLQTCETMLGLIDKEFQTLLMSNDTKEFIDQQGPLVKDSSDEIKKCFDGYLELFNDSKESWVEVASDGNNNGITPSFMESKKKSSKAEEEQRAAH